MRSWGLAVPPGPTQGCARSRRAQPRVSKKGPLAGQGLVLLGHEVLVALTGQLLDRQGVLLAQLLAGQVGQAIALDVVGVGQADRAQPLADQPVVDLVEVLLDQLPLGVGDLALVWLARVLQARVVDLAGGGAATPGPAAAAGGRGPGP